MAVLCSVVLAMTEFEVIENATPCEKVATEDRKDLRRISKRKKKDFERKRVFERKRI